jgi:AbrB family looped-hinge helix DNA binding protein
MTTKPHRHAKNPEETVLPTTAKARPRSRVAKELVCGVLAESILTSKGQVTIPQAIRSKFQLDAGDSLVWQLDGDGRLFVEPKRALTLADIRAAIAVAGIPVPRRSFTPEEMKEAIGQALEAKYGRH